MRSSSKRAPSTSSTAATPTSRACIRITEALAFFVIRGKRGLDYVRRVSRPVDKTTGLRSDQTIVLCGPKTATLYPVPLRRITYVDPETRQRFVFLTNNFTLPALQIAQLYKCRWQVELFFKWIKQHLRIKAFYGTSVNAVKTQVWIAISVYVLVAILKKQPGAAAEPLRNPPNSERHPVRANAHSSSPRAIARPEPRERCVTSCRCSIYSRTVVGQDRLFPLLFPIGTGGC